MTLVIVLNGQHMGVDMFKWGVPLRQDNSMVLPNVLNVCVALLMRSTTADIPGNETDRLALLAFKDQVTQLPSGLMTSWNDSLHFCEWGGITCSNQHQRVIALDLRSQGLVGSLSPHIGNLSFLRSIILQNNSLQGKLPDEVGRLSRLQNFRMNNNSFSGQLPVNFSYCSNLINLTLAYNKLVGNIPVEFGSLSKMVILDLFVNNFTGSIPDSFGNLSSIEHLIFSTNKMDGRIPDSLGQLRKLKVISLGLNMFSGMVPASLYNMSSLETFSMPLNQLEGSFPSGLGVNLPNLNRFFIGGNRFSGSIPASFITNALGLVRLDLSFNNFTGRVPTEVGLLKDLERIQVDSNRLGNGLTGDLDFITSLTNCSNLQVLSMALNYFGGKLPNSIANLSTRVNELYLGGNQISGTIPSDVVNLDNLMILALEVNLMSGIIPESIGNFQKLQILSLQGNKFSGPIPSSVGNISQLYYLDVSDNELEGNISSLEECKFLQTFNLSYNHLSGTIPAQVLVSLSDRLTRIILAHNSFIGSLPPEVENLRNLQMLDISDNKISGEIPSNLGRCLSLVQLYLQGNILNGSIPSSFNSLKVVQKIDLSRNKLSGKIPKDLEDLTFLKYLNLSYNDFEDEVPIKGVFQNASSFSLVGNDRLCGGIPELDLLKCSLQNTKKQGNSLVLKVTLGLVIPLFVIAALLFVLYLTKWRKPESSSKHLLGSEQFSVSRLRTVSYNDLWQATNGFTSENLIGMGSCGSVYKGVLHEDEIPIAVKVLNLVEHGVSKSFVAECDVLRKVRHRNLLKIITVCASLDSKGNDFKALVFKFMPNGSVEDWLHPSLDTRDMSKNLNLLQRLNIAIDVASALDYLHNHCETPIVHCDLKSSNILLDDDMVAYVADFGLAKILPKITSKGDRNDIFSASLRGTIGYIPPGKRPTDEMFEDGLSLRHFSKLALNGQVLDKIDTHLLYEGTRNIATEKHVYNTNKMQECLRSIIRIGLACSSESATERMDIDDVLMELHAIKEDWHFIMKFQPHCCQYSHTGRFCRYGEFQERNTKQAQFPSVFIGRIRSGLVPLTPAANQRGGFGGTIPETPPDPGQGVGETPPMRTWLTPPPPSVDVPPP
ncbi:hypothetical protein AQUCO_06100091v1 [Aquilegia coerulea]|uniref:non-specific serine/threonine protein kinase n=1 Tax=Aquilegia coerulea TaxID=218851 RepID=A0A2G5CDJ8_AQUCA|nr:hypothetical protein AQUCO_06100091v1 [Aquilegia coerulea]